MANMLRRQEGKLMRKIGNGGYLAAYIAHTFAIALVYIILGVIGCMFS